MSVAPAANAPAVMVLVVPNVLDLKNNRVTALLAEPSVNVPLMVILPWRSTSDSPVPIWPAIEKLLNVGLSPEKLHNAIPMPPFIWVFVNETLYQVLFPNCIKKYRLAVMFTCDVPALKVTLAPNPPPAPVA